jgi:hypothetical protein
MTGEHKIGEAATAKIVGGIAWQPIPEPYDQKGKA